VRNAPGWIYGQADRGPVYSANRPKRKEGRGYSPL